MRQTWMTGACAVFLLGALLPLLYLTSHRPGDRGAPSAELSFTDPSHIASWAGQRSVTFRFVIRNLAQQRHAYRYAVAVSSKGRAPVPRGSGLVDLGPGESRLVRWTETSTPRGRFEISVSVPGTGSRIDFWTHAPSS